METLGKTTRSRSSPFLVSSLARLAGIFGAVDDSASRSLNAARDSVGVKSVIRRLFESVIVDEAAIELDDVDNPEEVVG